MHNSGLALVFLEVDCYDDDDDDDDDDEGEDTDKAFTNMFSTSSAHRLTVDAQGPPTNNTRRGGFSSCRL